MPDLRDWCVSRETLEDLQTYANLLKRWNIAINLVSKHDTETLWDRHFVDSAQLYELAQENFTTWVDLGSGGGFPGIVCAVMAKHQNSDATFTLVESDKRKAVFLKEVSRTLGVNVDVRNERIQTVVLNAPSVISARALASLDSLFTYAHRLCGEQTVLLFPKGRSYVNELTHARNSWHMECECVPSRTDPEGAILRITGLQKNDSFYNA